MTWVYGADASFSRVTQPEFQVLKEQYGIRVFVQCLWTGGYANNDALRQVAEPNINDAAAVGLIPAGYSNSSPWYGSTKWWPPDVTLKETKKNAGAAWPGLTVVSNDVETRGLTERCIRETQEALESEGKRVPIYTARWFWHGVLGNPMWSWAGQRQLWNAYYDDDPDIDFMNAPYGPWTQDKVIGEQYKNTTYIGDDGYDFNVFNQDYFTIGGNDMVTDAQWNDLMGKVNFIYAVFNDLQAIPGNPPIAAAKRWMVWQTMMTDARQAALNVDRETDPICQQWPALKEDVEDIKAAVESGGGGGVNYAAIASASALATVDLLKTKKSKLIDE